MTTGAVERVQLKLPVIQESPPASATRRACDGCTVCCVALTINDPQLVAPAGEACPHLASYGCSIHGGTRPRICGEYVCHYLMAGEDLDVDDRPDRTGAIVGFSPAPNAALPFDYFIHIVEHRRDGLAGVLARPVWRGILAERLRSGIPIHVNRWDDPRQEEAALIRLIDGRGMIRLQSCHEDGAVLLAALKPSHGRELWLAVDDAAWGYPFEARALRQRLAAATSAIIGPLPGPARTHFRVTRWQAAVSVALERLARLG